VLDRLPALEHHPAGADVASLVHPQALKVQDLGLYHGAP
jgi:hypothetical protein